ncbi:hypothetical protein NQ317_010246 [Molorchus minor]|uniref:DUF5641 domain-containing protein n=1 Tax=Molorchus minor TaxID=1323400 RepID=A0ABQ9JHV2_9CUCU|nr:hypothetical protein NQ317_010246 [Molorchus minor]
MVQAFWTRWSKEYIANELLKPDVLVIIKEDHLPPCKWALGRVLQLHPGADGITRVITVKTHSVTPEGAPSDIGSTALNFGLPRSAFEGIEDRWAKASQEELVCPVHPNLLGRENSGNNVSFSLPPREPQGVPGALGIRDSIPPELLGATSLAFSEPTTVTMLQNPPTALLNNANDSTESVNKADNNVTLTITKSQLSNIITTEVAKAMQGLCIPNATNVNIGQTENCGTARNITTGMTQPSTDYAMPPWHLRYSNNINRDIVTQTNLADPKICKFLPTFNPDGQLHPVDFISFVEAYVDVNNISMSQFALLAHNLLENSAKTWFNAFENVFTSYREFKCAFLEQFWGQNKQLQTKLKLESGRYREGDGSLVTYFNRYVAMAKHLQPPYASIQLIATIAQHFPPNIAATLVGTDNLLAALDRLRQADYYFKNSEKKQTFFITNK